MYYNSNIYYNRINTLFKYFLLTNYRYLEENKKRSKNYRKNRNEEQKDVDREKARIRAKQYRDRMKEKYGSTVPLSRKANIKTRREVANQREYWRKKKQDSRSRLHAQKKRRIKEYDRKRKMESKKVLNGDLTPTITDENESVRIFTPEAERKAFSRAKKYIPKDPKRYAGIVSKLITKASPKKKAALANLYEGVKQNDTIKQIAHRMKQNQKKEGKQFTRHTERFLC